MLACIGCWADQVQVMMKGKKAEEIGKFCKAQGELPIIID